MVPRLERCPVCDGSLRAAEPPGSPDGVVRCSSCGHGVYQQGGTPPDLGWRDGTSAQTKDPQRHSSWEQFDSAWLRLQLLRQLLPATGELLDLHCGHDAFAAVVATSPFEISSFALCDVPPDRSFDAITLWSGLDASHEPVEDLVRLRRHLRPGGVLVVAVRPSAAEPSVVQAFTRESLVLALQRAGFDPLPPRELSAEHADARSRVWQALDLARAASPLAPLLQRAAHWFDRLAERGDDGGQLIVAALRPGTADKPSSATTSRS